MIFFRRELASIALLLVSIVFLASAIPSAGAEQPTTYALADIIRKAATDPMFRSAENLRNARNESERKLRQSPKAGPFLELNRSTDNSSPSGFILDDEYLISNQYVRYDNSFGGVELLMPIAGGQVQLRAGERSATLTVGERLNDPNTERIRVDGQILIPLLPWRLDLAQLNEVELRNEIEFREEWAAYRRRVASHVLAAARSAWQNSAVSAINDCLSPAASYFDTASILFEYGEISASALDDARSALSRIRSLRSSNLAGLAEARALLSPLFGDAWTITVPGTLPEPHEVTFPPPLADQDAVRAEARLAHSQSRAGIAKKETGAEVGLQAKTTSDYFQDPDARRDRIRNYVGLSVSVPFINPAGTARREASTAELELASKRYQDALVQAAIRHSQTRSEYAEALRESADIADEIARLKKSLVIAREEFDAYVDPERIVDVIRAEARIASAIDSYSSARIRAVSILMDGLITSGLGIESLVSYFP